MTGNKEPDIRFALETVDLGIDQDGDSIRSCVVRWRSASDFEKLPLSAAAESMWEAFQIGAKEAGGFDNWRTTVITTDAWEAAYIELKREAEDGQGGGSAAISAAIRGLSPRTLRRLRQIVKDSGHVQEVEADQWVAL